MKFTFLLFFVNFAYGATDYLKYFEADISAEEIADQSVITQRGYTEEYDERTATIGFSSPHTGTRFATRDVGSEGSVDIHVPHGHGLTLKSSGQSLILVSGELPDVTDIKAIHFRVQGDVLVTDDDNTKLCFSKNHGIHLESPHHQCQYYLTAHGGHVAKSRVAPIVPIVHRQEHPEHHKAPINQLDKVPDITHEHEHAHRVARGILNYINWKVSMIILFIAIALYYFL